MKIKFKSVLFVLSLILNGVFILLFVMASLSKNESLYYYAPGNGYTTAAAVIGFPPDAEASFELITAALRPGDKFFLQFVFITPRQQGSLIINPLYDPNIISVIQTGYGLEITALSEGETLMQAFTNNGVKNVALITVSK